MAGVPLTSFLDWVINTGPQFLSGPGHIVNSISRRSYVIGKFLRGKSANEMLQGSNEIRETLKLLPNRVFRMFQRGESQSWTNRQNDVNVKYQYKFGLGEIAWDEVEYLNQTSGLTGGRLATTYKNMARSKQMTSWEDVVDGMEDQMWYAPNGAATFAAMESGGKLAYSIPAFVHENSSNSGGFDSNWTTVGQVTQATYSTNWDNQRATYSATDPADNGNTSTGLFDALDDISISTGFERPGMKDQFWQPDNSYGPGERSEHSNCIATSKNGKKLLMRLHRINNDSLIKAQDGAYANPTWNGIPFKDVAALDTAALYDDGSSGFVTEEAATVSASGPRFYCLNTDYLKLVFHEEKCFKMEKMKEPHDKVGEYVIPIQVWFNLVCTGRRYQGIVSPT